MGWSKMRYTPEIWDELAPEIWPDQLIPLRWCELPSPLTRITARPEQNRCRGLLPSFPAWIAS
jgi:hypothetical protein